MHFVCCTPKSITNTNFEDVWNVVGQVDLDTDGSDGGVCFGSLYENQKGVSDILGEMYVYIYIYIYIYT